MSSRGTPFRLAKVAEAAVRVTLERKADLALPTPKWVLENVGKQSQLGTF